MKIFINTFLILFFIAFFQGCSEKFEDINFNPNVPEEADPQFLLSNILSVSANENAYNQGFRLSNYLGQYSADIEFERIDRYEMGSNASHWELLYHLMSDIRTMQQSESSNEAYQAVGNIMKAYFASQLTDMWGDVPFSEAVQALDNQFTPKYDTQEDIYMHAEHGIFALLQSSINVLKNTNAKINGDVMFQGDLTKWIKFANALQIRYYVRVGNRLSDFSKLQQIVNSGDFQQSNDDNAVIPYLPSAPNQFPLSQASEGIYTGVRMSATIDSILNSWSDPRLGVLFKPTENSIRAGQPTFNGLPNGLSRETIGELGIELSDLSLFGSIFRDMPNGVDGPFIIYAETMFNIAEAIERGYINADQNASDFYRKGIEAHFDYLGLEVPSDYLNSENIQLNGQNHLSKILTQKWITLINNAHESWFQMRRTGIPQPKPGLDNLNDGRYPSRYLYPESEQATNAQNYQEAVNRVGGDNINIKSWWDQD